MFTTREPWWLEWGTAGTEKLAKHQREIEKKKIRSALKPVGGQTSVPKCTYPAQTGVGKHFPYRPMCASDDRKPGHDSSHTRFGGKWNSRPRGVEHNERLKAETRRKANQPTERRSRPEDIRKTPLGDTNRYPTRPRERQSRQLPYTQATPTTIAHAPQTFRVGKIVCLCDLFFFRGDLILARKSQPLGEQGWV